MANPKERYVAAALAALVDGIDKGLERRRKYQMEDEELLLKKQELDARTEDRKLQRESNDLYRQALLKGQAETRDTTKKTKNRELDLKAQEIASKDDGKEEAKQLQAGDQLRKFQEDKGKVEKRLAMFESELASNPESPEIAKQVDTLRKQARELNSQMRTAKVISIGANKEIRPYLEQFDHITDPQAAKKHITALIKSGRFKEDSVEMKLILDEYLEKFGQ